MFCLKSSIVFKYRLVIFEKLNTITELINDTNSFLLISHGTLFCWFTVNRGIRKFQGISKADFHRW